LIPDDSDVQLAVGLNRALGACTSDGIIIVRDDAQLPRGTIERLVSAFGASRASASPFRASAAPTVRNRCPISLSRRLGMQSLYDRRPRLSRVKPTCSTSHRRRYWW